MAHTQPATAPAKASTASNAAPSKSRSRKPKPTSSSNTNPNPADPLKAISPSESKRSSKASTPAAPAAAAEQSNSSSKSSRRSRSKKEKESNPDKRSKSRLKTKVVIRRLPPNVPQDVFWNSVATWVRDAAQAKALREAAEQAGPLSDSRPAASSEPTVDYKCFVPGKLKSDPNKENVSSRAYVRFLDPAMVVEFHKNFDGHVFRDRKGNESVAVVEFAPYQKVPAERRRKVDARQGTIEADAEFKAFVENLEEKKSEQSENKTDAELMAHLTQSDKVQTGVGKSTPLLEHLRAIKAARAESSAYALAKAYKNSNAYAYPDDKPGSSKTKPATASKAKAAEPRKSALKKSDPAAGAEEAKAGDPSASAVVVEAKKPKSVVSGRAFGAALSGAVGSAVSGRAVKESGKGKERAKDSDEAAKTGAAKESPRPASNATESNVAPAARAKATEGKGRTRGHGGGPSKADVSTSSIAAAQEGRTPDRPATTKEAPAENEKKGPSRRERKLAKASTSRAEEGSASNVAKGDAVSSAPPLAKAEKVTILKREGTDQGEAVGAVASTGRVGRSSKRERSDKREKESKEESKGGKSKEPEKTEKNERAGEGRRRRRARPKDPSDGADASADGAGRTPPVGQAIWD